MGLFSYCRSCFDQSNTSNMLLIVQCDCGDQNADLIACARYTVQGELQQVQQDRTSLWHPCGVPNTTTWYSWGMFYWFAGRYSILSCARCTVQEELQQVRQDKTTDIHVVFLIQLPGIAGGCFTGFQVGIAYCLVLGTQYRESYDKIEPLISMLWSWYNYLV
jgi:hypothetical protein